MTISLPYYQVRAPEDYRLTFRTPSGCNISNCTSFVGIDVNAGNGAFLDIYMEGEAQGWVGVGFSETRDMVSGRHVYMYDSDSSIIQLLCQFSFFLLLAVVCRRYCMQQGPNQWHGGGSGHLQPS